MAITKGSLVRLINDPGRSGIVISEAMVRAGRTKFRVKFTDGNSTHRETDLELVPEGSPDPYQLLLNGQYGRVGDLRRNLTHIQLSGKLANLVYSMDTTNTDFYAYQYKPLVSFMDSPAKGILIADEVGLGKTIEAGLIWTELRARFDARRLLVVCKNSLIEKWCDELRNRFGIDARKCNTEELLQDLRLSRYEVPDGRALVCSLDGIKPPKNWDKADSAKSNRQKLAALFDENEGREPLIDLVIIDEAHYLRNPSSQNAKLGQMLREVAENVVLLSATPVNLKSEDLFHLLNLVDADTFDRPEFFPMVLEANGPLIKAREAALDLNCRWGDVRNHLEIAQKNALLKDNKQLEGILSDNSTPGQFNSHRGRVRLANRIERINLLRNVVSRTRKIEVTELRVVREPVTHFVPLDPLEAEFYNRVTNGVRRFAMEKDISEGFLLAQPQRQVSSCMYAAAKSWTRGNWYDESLSYEDIGIESEYPASRSSPLIDSIRNESLSNISMDALREVDSKYHALRDLLVEFYQDFPGEKVILFSYYRETLKYLLSRLAEEGIDGQILMGGMKETKQEVIDRFRESEDTHILLCSEVASEGVDLQFCRVLINYDLPWNPMKVEQRIGRIDRIGQLSPKISIINLCYAETIDQRVHQRLFQRLEIFERSLGGLEAVLGEAIAELTKDLLSRNLTVEQEEQRIEKTAVAVENIRNEEEVLEKQASNLIAHSGFILEQVQAAHEFKKRITEDDLVVYVRDYLEKYCPGHLFQQLSSDILEFSIQLPGQVAAAFDVYLRKHNLLGKTELSTGDKRICLFENKVSRPNGIREVISQFHPFVRFIGYDLNERSEAFYPLVAIQLASKDCKAPKGLYAFSVKRWSFEGLRTDEELHTRAISLDSEALFDPDDSWDLINSARVSGGEFFSAKNLVDHNLLETKIELCTNEIDEDFDIAREQRNRENTDRVNLQIQSAQRYRDRQLDIQNTLIERYRAEGKDRGFQLAVGKSRAIKQRFDLQVEQLKLKSVLRFSDSDVCCGVISVA